MKVFNQLWKYKMSIIVVTVLLTMGTSLLQFLVAYNKQSMVLTISYDETNKGLNPDKSRFNMFELRSDEVLDRAIGLSGLQNVGVADMKKRVDISPIIPRAVAGRVRSSVEAGLEYAYIPNEFTISYSQKNKFEKNHTVEFLEAMAEAYQEIFFQKYVLKNTILKMPDQPYDNYEYTEIATFYTYQVDAMMAYIQKQNEDNGTFRASSTALTFGDVYAMLNNLKTIDIEKFKHYVISSGLTKNQTAYENKLKFTVDQETLDYEKASQGADVTKAAIQQYDPKITGVIFVPSVDENREYYMNRTKTGIDYLTTDAFNRGTNATNIKASIDYNKYLIASFGKPVSGPEGERMRGEAESLMLNIQNKLTEISQLAIKTDDEFLENKTGKYIKFNIPDKGLKKAIKPQTIVMNGAKSFFVALVGVYLFALGMEKWVAFKRRKEWWKS